MSEYEDLVELGFEGVDKFADKYHDHVYPHLPAIPFRKRKNSRDQPPNKHDQKRSPPRQRKNNEPPDDRYDSAGEKDDDMTTAHPSDRRRDDDYYQDDREAAYYSRGRAGDRDSRDYVRDDTTVVVRGRDPYYSGGYQVAPRPPSPRYGRPRGDCDDAYAYGVGYGQGYVQARERPAPRRRPSSYSPQRQARDYSPPRRYRSKSPNHHRVAATLIGALAGGVLGHNIKKGEGSGAVLTTVGGAIAGGIVGRKGEEWWDERQEREARREERHRRERAYEN